MQIQRDGGRLQVFHRSSLMANYEQTKLRPWEMRGKQKRTRRQTPELVCYQLERKRICSTTSSSSHFWALFASGWQVGRVNEQIINRKKKGAEWTHSDKSSAATNWRVVRYRSHVLVVEMLFALESGTVEREIMDKCDINETAQGGSDFFKSFFFVLLINNKWLHRHTRQKWQEEKKKITHTADCHRWL